MAARTTQCYIEKDGQILMLHRVKKHQDPNAGKWIGIGGHIEPGETPEICMRREALEETGLYLNELCFAGLVHFLSDCWEDEDMYIFTCKSFSGRLTECDEGDLQWIDREKVPELPTWEGDAVFLKPLLSGETGFEITLRYKGEKLTDVQYGYLKPEG